MEASTSSLPVVASTSANRALQSQHSLMADAMLEAKRARIKVENDREALANRISRLQMEEVRATKRIEQTHKRTQQILAAKDRHLQSQSQKEQMRQEQEQVVQERVDDVRAVRAPCRP